MTQTFSPLGEVLAQALRLPAKERMQLIEQVAASVEREIVTVEPSPVTEHWGHSLNALLDSLNMDDWEQIEDTDVWLKQVREAEARERLGDWGANE